MKNARKKEMMSWLRMQMLELIKVSLRLFKHTHNKKFYEYAQWFGNQSRELKEELKKL